MDAALDELSTDRIVLVTGGVSGIGAACVERFVAAGDTVAATYLQPGELDTSFGATVWDMAASVHALDLRDVDSIRRCIAEVVAVHGRIDVLVNNAAVGSGTVARMADDEAGQDSAMLAVNADGTLKMAQEFITASTGRDRKLVSLSSVGGGVAAFPGFRLSDGMSKAAVAFMTRQLAAETVHADLDVFAVCPGATDTPMLRASTLDAMTRDERASFEARLPKGRLIQPGEIAEIVHFLTTPPARVLHGAVIDASMGLGVRPGLMTEYDGI